MKTILLSALVFFSACFACNLEARPAHRHHHHHHHHHSSRPKVHLNFGTAAVAPAMAVPVAVPVVAPVAAYVPVQPAPVMAYPATYYYPEYYYQAPAPCVNCYQPAVVAPQTWTSMNLGFSFRL